MIYIYTYRCLSRSGRIINDLYSLPYIIVHFQISYNEDNLCKQVENVIFFLKANYLFDFIYLPYGKNNIPSLLF